MSRRAALGRRSARTNASEGHSATRAASPSRRLVPAVFFPGLHWGALVLRSGLAGWVDGKGIARVAGWGWCGCYRALHRCRVIRRLVVAQ
eukprot:6992644-Alexandrium_andersonii.AAC.1